MRSQSSVLGEFFFFSVLMFTLPFGAYYGTKSLLEQQTFQSTVHWEIFIPVMSSVFTMWTIIAVYVCLAYRDKSNYEPVKED